VIRASRDDYRTRRECLSVRRDDEAIRVPHERRDARVQPHWQREVPDIRLQVPRDGVFDGQRVGLAGERQAGQRVVADRGEQAQRVPAPQPRFANLTTAVEYQEPGTRALQVVRRRESGLSGSDNDGVVEVAHQTCAGVRRSVLLAMTSHTPKPIIHAGRR
jgi:hypothetical protein